MVFMFYLILNICVTFSFFKFQNKQITKLEIFTYWCLSSLLIQNYSAIQTMNYKTSIVPHLLSPGLSHFVNRTVLYPVITLFFLNQFCGITTFWKKIILICGYAALLTGMEELSSFLQVFHHITWTAGWAYLFWLIELIAMTGCMMYFHKRLKYKGRIELE